MTFGRDALRDARETQRLEKDSPTPERNGPCMLGLPDWLAGGVAVVFGTLFMAPLQRSMGAWDQQVYADEQEAYRLAGAQLDFYRRLAERSERFELVEHRAALTAVLDSWESDTPRVGIVPLMEGADPIRRPAEALEWYERGVRLVGLSWMSASRYAGGDAEPGPLTDEGRELLEALAEVGMILDVSHLAEAAFWQTVDRYEGPLVASHANPRALVDIPRNLSNRMIEAVAERDGVIGVMLFNRFLKPGWVRQDGKQTVPLQYVAAAIDHVCQLVGDAAHVGIGSDFDGGFGADATPAGIETVADLPKIGDALREWGYREADIAAVMGENWLRVLRAALHDP